MTKETKWIYTLSFLFIAAIASAVIHTRVAHLSPEKTSKPLKLLNQNGIAIIDIFGPISFSSKSQTSFPSGATATLKQLKEIEKNKNVKALIIRINSPGGTVGASQELYDAIKAYKANTQVPIIASIGDIGASGAFYAAVAADRIYANPGSLVGSIGVILGNIQLEEFAQKYGIDFQVYKSGKYKDSLSPWRAPSEKEQQLLQTLVDNVHQQFVSAVKKGRNLNENQAQTLAQGQIFTGEQAVNVGLIDRLGNLENAIQDAAEQANLGENPLIINTHKPDWVEMMNIWRNQMGSWFKTTTLSQFNQPTLQ